MLILGIDTSCDDTGVGLVRLEGGRPEILSNLIWTQEVHSRYGGVMPELASREHVERIDGVVSGALAARGSRCRRWMCWPLPTVPGSSARCWWG